MGPWARARGAVSPDEWKAVMCDLVAVLVVAVALAAGCFALQSLAGLVESQEAKDLSLPTSRVNYCGTQAADTVAKQTSSATRLR
jgi:hypothetical protein